MVSASDDDQLWQAYHATRSPEARDALLARYAPMALRSAKALLRRLPRFQATLDELYSPALEGLTEAIERHEPQRGAFSTFVYPRIRGAMLDWLRSNRPRGVPRGSEHWRTQQMGQTLTERLQKTTTRCEAGDLAALLRGLGKFDRLLVILYYHEELTMKEIGRSLGVSESRVSQRHDQILEFLRYKLQAPAVPKRRAGHRSTR